MPRRPLLGLAHRDPRELRGGGGPHAVLRRQEEELDLLPAVHAHLQSGPPRGPTFCPHPLMAFVFHNIYLIVFSYLFTGILGTFINAAPNKWLIGYSYAEQLRDIAPAFIISFVSGLCAYSVVFFNASSILTIVLEMFVLALVYLGLSKLLHFEAFYYLVITARDYLGAKRK